LNFLIKCLSASGPQLLGGVGVAKDIPYVRYEVLTTARMKMKMAVFWDTYRAV
jgi:hypothetical protein